MALLIPQRLTSKNRLPQEIVSIGGSTFENSSQKFHPVSAIELMYHSANHSIHNSTIKYRVTSHCQNINIQATQVSFTFEAPPSAAHNLDPRIWNSKPRPLKMATQYPEGRVLIIMTGGTICMKTSPEGLVPARGFLDAGMAPRPSFNDGSKQGKKQLILILGP